MRRLLPLLLLLLLAACGPAGLPPSQSVAAIGNPAPRSLASPTASLTPSPVATARVFPTATSTATPSPTSTLRPSPTLTPTPSPTPTRDPASLVNGVPVEHFVVMPPETVANVRRIFAHGQELGRNPRAFSKLGDSISLTSHYFARFDQSRYNLGIYSALQPTIDYYDHSFERFGMAVRIGLLAWISFRPGVADPQLCRPEEHMVECELRLHNPSVLVIRLGTNDIAPGDAFERAIRHAIETSIAEGIIPLLVTKSDRFEGDNRHNETLRALAAEYAVPLWDFDLVAGTLPDRGLGGDAVHLTMYASDDFSDPAALSFGYPLSDLTGLFALDAIRRVVEGVE
ncbi:MAG: SGNH/GDSL hydrolase family protein [Candidatus Promineofilum sp.]|nr:SGNH/GDSL hydrolase family protein [Promineifilum sp.]